MKIGIANDHTATDMKKELVEYLEAQGHEVINFGTDGSGKGHCDLRHRSRYRHGMQ